jgi:hypothetical protein
VWISRAGNHGHDALDEHPSGDNDGLELDTRNSSSSSNTLPGPSLQIPRNAATTSCLTPVHNVVQLGVLVDGRPRRRDAPAPRGPRPTPEVPLPLKQAAGLVLLLRYSMLHRWLQGTGNNCQQNQKPRCKCAIEHEPLCGVNKMNNMTDLQWES